ncbi:MAG: hypothetical protein PHP45_07660 [Elusimicrobiales bacterium]|nr:hypothetical protein [Elusimicrobiales bacterium]
MDANTETKKLIHELESKTASLKSAANLLREFTTPEKRKMIALMRDATKEIQQYLAELEKSLDY